MGGVAVGGRGGDDQSGYDEVESGGGSMSGPKYANMNPLCIMY